MKTVIRIFLVVLALLSFSSCGRRKVVYVNSEPPVPQTENAPPPPHGRHAWVPGHWERRGNRWVWMAGYYKKVPKQHHTWVPGHWERRGNRWIWKEGHWR